MLYFGNTSTIDLDALYQETLHEIDQYRSDEYLAADKLTLENIHQEESNLKPSPIIKQTYNTLPGTFNILTVKETRAHAFYRILGLPMTDEQDFFNPGYTSDRTKDKTKIQICNRIFKTTSYKTLLSSYSYQESILKILRRKDINSSVLVLSSLNKRDFADPISNPSQDMLSVEETDVSYTISMKDFKGRDYNQYTDYRKSKPVNLPTYFGKNAATRKHYILPMILDPKIVFAITNSKNVNAPFFILKGPDCDPNIQYAAPTIQSIIIERFSNQVSPAKITPSQQEIIDNINNLPNIMPDNDQISKDVEIIDGLFKRNKTNNYYFNFISTATELMKILKQNVLAAKSAQEKYHLIPATEGSSPEQAVSISKIYGLDPNNSENEKKIVSEILKTASAEMRLLFSRLINIEENPPVNTAQKTVLSGTTVTPSVDPVKTETSAFNYQKLIDQRKKEEEAMSKSLKYMEYLMGEFSGFGICDMFVIISAFYLLEDNVLLSFLDDDSFDRAKDPYFKLSLPDKSVRVSIIEAFGALAEIIRNLYLTMDAIYLSLPKSS